MKIAYLILTHNQPFHLRRLIDSLTYKENRFYIHVDKRASMSQFDTITSTRAHFIQDRVPCAWADYSLVQATLNLMRSALRSEHEFDYLILLSGVCYPLKSN